MNKHITFQVTQQVMCSRNPSNIIDKVKQISPYGNKLPFKVIWKLCLPLKFLVIQNGVQKVNLNVNGSRYPASPYDVDVDNGDFMDISMACQNQ